MASARVRRLRNYLTALAALGLGLWLAGSALWQLARTAVFVHESVVVTGTVIDVRQKPFENWSETLGEGNWSMPGAPSYQPIVRFTLPGGINAIRLDLPADNADYQLGQDIRIISPPTQPGKARIYERKFLWGASTLRLMVGSLAALVGFILLRRLRGRRSEATSAPSPALQSADAQRKTPSRRKSSANSAPASGSRRKKKEASNSHDEAEPPKKPRCRSRRKKAAGQSPELPL